MARAIMHLCVASVMVLLAKVFMAEAARYTPGIDNPRKATCKNKEYKERYNLPHVCPKFCGDSGFNVNCVSCKPVCGPDNGKGPTPSIHHVATPSYEPTPSTLIYPTPINKPTSSPLVYPTPPNKPTPSPPVSPRPPSTPAHTPTILSVPSNSEFSAKDDLGAETKNTVNASYNVEHVCHATYPTRCVVDCVTCKPMCSYLYVMCTCCDQPGTIYQDPGFIGSNGITFYFHEKQNFICVLFGDHQICIGARMTAVWVDFVDHLELAFDGQPIYLSSTTNTIIVEVEGNFRVTANVVPITEEESTVHNYGITKDNCFVKKK
ncbi:hypothetical protein MKW98_023130 [Papaver atlanticum]|uniref:Uncharacterized protein n=1 Tax=Papaver atlanticum TaxID=357466 RepID=A0AAD4T7R4_9MAGN|nr:hypothetical protein MKW98_023130 [Papaver atlanticum]